MRRGKRFRIPPRVVGLTAALAGALVSTPAVAARAAGERPVIVVLADNEGTETTDFLVPFGVLSASGAADVVAASTHAGPVPLMPGVLTIETPLTLAGFDARTPGGADYVIVPALHRSDSPEVVAWLRAQAERGATLVGICDGVWTVAATGRLDGRAATGHWYSRPKLAEAYPTAKWRDDRRYLHDGDVITTTGISASLPASLYLVERIAGRPRAEALARELGVPDWSDVHAGSEFHLTLKRFARGLVNYAAFWRHERIGIAVAPGADEVALGFAVDALTRTYRAEGVAVAEQPGRVTTRFGLVVQVTESRNAPDLTPAFADVAGGGPAGQTVDRTLAAIAGRYGEATADLVALQLEYPRRPDSRDDQPRVRPDSRDDQPRGTAH